MNINEKKSPLTGEQPLFSTVLNPHESEEPLLTNLPTIYTEVLAVLDKTLHMLVADAKGTIIYVNDRCCELTKYARHELIGQNYRILSTGLYTSSFFEHILATLRSGRVWQGEIKNVAKDGTIFVIDNMIIPILNDEKKISHYIGLRMPVSDKLYRETPIKANVIQTFQAPKKGVFKVRRHADGSYVYTMAEGQLLDAVGASNDVMVGKTPHELFDASVAALKERKYAKAFAGERVQYELEINGARVYIDIEPYEGGMEEPEIFGTVHDFSAFRGVQKQSKVNEERYQSLIHYSHEYILMLDKHGTVLHMNPKTMQLFDIDQTQFGQLNIADATHESDRRHLALHFEKALRGEVQFFEFAVKHSAPPRVLTVTFVPTFVDGELDVIYAIGKDITDEKLVHERNAYFAHHDELTGLDNRRSMEKKIKQALDEAARKGHKLAILSLDLDRFKSINDTLGHFVGDGLLKQIAKRLCYSHDQHELHIARMGGDEFMLLCPNVVDEEAVLTIAKEILQRLEKPFYVQGFELLTTASIGIVFASSEEMDVTELLKQVDMALYKSKELGRNMYQVFDYSMHRGNYQSFVMERDLRKAIIHDEFIVHLQPRIDVTTNKIVGAEALVRWQHPTQGLISPAQFIPLAEESGLIIAIGKMVKKKVCEQLVSWRALGLPLIPISVNISSNRFLQHGFAQDIQELLHAFNLEGQWLEIEVTENSIMRNEDIVQKTLHRLKEMGVKIYIDDFGTGYSSFSYLKTFKIDGIKIDQSFVRNIARNTENATITSAMIKMAQLLKLEVIAEGVETVEELQYLIDENCYVFQGFYFSKPCPFDEFEQKLIAQQHS